MIDSNFLKHLLKLYLYAIHIVFQKIVIMFDKVFSWFPKLLNQYLHSYSSQECS